MQVRCECEECKYNEEGCCDQEVIIVSNSELTAAGFVPLCTDYEEETC